MRPLLVLLALAAPMLGGCLRTRVDLCAQVPPHPECAYLDAGRDAPPTDAPPSDAAPDDGSVDAADAPVEDAPAEDAPVAPDAPADG
jgi:hypothetical protein